MDMEIDAAPEAHPFRHIPDFLWQRIIDENGFKTLFRLRKICAPLRDFFDNVSQPNIKLEWLKLSVITNGVWIRFGTDVNDAKNWEYDPKKQGRILVVEGNREGWKDLATVLKFQKSSFKKLILTFNLEENLKENAKFLECFKNILSILPNALRVEHLHMTAMDQSQLLQILPSIEPSLLEKVEIVHPKISESELNIDQIEQLPHFKTIKGIHIISRNHNIRPHQFRNVPNFNLTVESMSANELIYVLDHVIKIPTFQFFEVRYLQFNGNIRLIDLWGVPERAFSRRNGYRMIMCEHWYFKDESPNILVVFKEGVDFRFLVAMMLTGEEAELNAHKAKSWSDWIGLADEETRRGIEAELGIVENVEE